MAAIEKEVTGAKETHEILPSLLKPEVYHPIKKFFQTLGRTVRDYFPPPVPTGLLGAGAFLVGNFLAPGSTEASGMVAGMVGFAFGFVGSIVAECARGPERETVYKSDD